jgi:hypothetical protein
MNLLHPKIFQMDSHSIMLSSNPHHSKKWLQNKHEIWIFWNYYFFSETFLHIGWIPQMKKENKSGGHYMSVLEQGVPEIRAPPTRTLKSPYFRNTPMT